MWNDGVMIEDCSDLVFGIYSVIVVDVNGCLVNISRIIIVDFVLIVMVDDVIVCVEENVILVVEVSSGIVFFIYVWSIGGSLFLIIIEDVFVMNIYIVIVIDVDGCIVMVLGIVNVNLLLVFDVSDDFIICEGELIILIVENVFFGILLFIYEWWNVIDLFIILLIIIELIVGLVEFVVG